MQRTYGLFSSVKCGKGDELSLSRFNNTRLTWPPPHKLSEAFSALGFGNMSCHVGEANMAEPQGWVRGHCLGRIRSLGSPVLGTASFSKSVFSSLSPYSHSLLLTALPLPFPPSLPHLLSLRTQVFSVFKHFLPFHLTPTLGTEQLSNLLPE